MAVSPPNILPEKSIGFPTLKSITSYAVIILPTELVFVIVHVLLKLGSSILTASRYALMLRVAPATIGLANCISILVINK